MVGEGKRANDAGWVVFGGVWRAWASLVRAILAVPENCLSEADFAKRDPLTEIHKFQFSAAVKRCTSVIGVGTLRKTLNGMDKNNKQLQSTPSPCRPPGNFRQSKASDLL